MAARKKISNVPTNIITGFLGVGKTSAILHLLKHKPKHERWAVLVNEFGEIGVDGSLFEGQQNEENGVFIRELPGGCMCCTAGFSMRVSLNILLGRARPDRLLIEPTGLGHPVEVLQVLTGEYYRDVLSIQKLLTLVDARKLADSRYTEHETFNQQIAIADVIVGNKRDLYQKGDVEALEAYAKKRAPNAQVFITEQAHLEPSWLEGPTSSVAREGHAHHHHEEDEPSLYDLPIPACGYVKAVNEGEGFKSIGWRITPHKIFDRDKLRTFFYSLDVERLKGVFITDEGIYGYNLTSDGLTEVELDDCLESRVEMIATELGEGWEKTLLGCVVSSSS